MLKNENKQVFKKSLLYVSFIFLELFIISLVWILISKLLVNNSLPKVFDGLYMYKPVLDNPEQVANVATDWRGDFAKKTLKINEVLNGFSFKRTVIAVFFACCFVVSFIAYLVQKKKNVLQTAKQNKFALYICVAVACAILVFVVIGFKSFYEANIEEYLSGSIGNQAVYKLYYYNGSPRLSSRDASYYFKSFSANVYGCCDSIVIFCGIASVIFVILAFFQKYKIVKRSD